MKKSSRVRLRLFKEKDFEFLHGLLTDPATKQYFRNLYTITKEGTANRLKGIFEDQYVGYNLRYVIEDKKLKQPVGKISGTIAKDDDKCIELAILVHPDYRGQGYAKEGAIEYIKKMRELRPEIVKYRMEIEESNKASEVVAKKLEFKLKSVREVGPLKTKMYRWEDREDAEK